MRAIQTITNVTETASGAITEVSTVLTNDYLGYGGMMVIVAWWGVWHIVSGLTLSTIWNIRGRKEAHLQ